MKLVKIVLLSLAMASAAAAQTPSSNAQAAFERLKQLQGEWQATTPDGKSEHLSYRLIAADSAIEERYSGQHGSMLTVYTLDGDHVLLTHYCMAHNQPRMTATALKNDELDFQFLDATGMATPDAGHMHNASFHFTDTNHFSTTWHFVENGKEKFTEEIQFARLR